MVLCTIQIVKSPEHWLASPGVPLFQKAGKLKPKVPSSVSFQWTKCDKVPLRVSFQSTKCTEMHFEVPFRWRYCPLGCLFGRLNMTRCPLRCPWSGENMIKCPLRWDVSAKLFFSPLPLECPQSPDAPEAVWFVILGYLDKGDSTCCLFGGVNNLCEQSGRVRRGKLVCFGSYEHTFFSICHLSWGWIYHSLCPGIDGSSGAISHLLSQKQHNASQMELFDVFVCFCRQ